MLTLLKFSAIAYAALWCLVGLIVGMVYIKANWFKGE